MYNRLLSKLDYFYEFSIKVPSILYLIEDDIVNNFDKLTLWHLNKVIDYSLDNINKALIIKVKNYISEKIA
jgi:hypothetical protein